MNVCDTDRYSTTLIFCRTMIIVYRCGNCFVCLTSSTSRLSFAEFLGKAEPSGGGSRSQWVLHLTRLTTAWKNEDGVLKSKRDMAAGVSALHVLAQTVGRRPSFRMVTEKGFLDESIGTSDSRAIFWLQTLSITFCNFLLFRSEKIWHLREDNCNTATKRHEGYMASWHVWRVLRRHLSDLEAIQMVDCDEYLVVVTGEFRLVSQWESMGELCQCTQCISVHLSAQKIKNLWFFSRISGRLVQPVAENVLNIVTRIEKNAKVKRQAGSQSIRGPGWRRAKSISLLGRAKGYFWRCEPLWRMAMLSQFTKLNLTEKWWNDVKCATSRTCSTSIFSVFVSVSIDVVDWFSWRFYDFFSQWYSMIFQYWFIDRWLFLVKSIPWLAWCIRPSSGRRAGDVELGSDLEVVGRICSPQKERIRSEWNMWNLCTQGPFEAFWSIFKLKLGQFDIASNRLPER